MLIMEKIKRIRLQDMAMEQIEWYIKENGLKPRTKLPSEREMCEMWDINRSALHAAIGQLIEKRVLYSEKGSGTYVAPSRIARDIQVIQSTSQAMKNIGYLLWSEVLTSRVEESDEYTSRKLKISEGSRVFHLCRVRLRNNIPLMIEDSYINYAQCEGIELHDFSEESLYQVLKTCGIQLSDGEETISITFATEEEARILKVDIGQYLYHQTGVTRDLRSRPVEFFNIMTRPDQILYTSILERKSSETEELEEL